MSSSCRRSQARELGRRSVVDAREKCAVYCEYTEVVDWAVVKKSTVRVRGVAAGVGAVGLDAAGATQGIDERHLRVGLLEIAFRQDDVKLPGFRKQHTHGGCG